MLIRALQVTALFLICAVSIVSMYAFTNGSLAGARPPVVEYKDFVTILLTALAVMIAVATFMGALAAVWGFTVLRDEAHRAAEAAAEKVAKAHVESTVPRLVEEAMNFAGQSKGTKADAVAEEYGKEGQ